MLHAVLSDDFVEINESLLCTCLPKNSHVCGAAQLSRCVGLRSADALEFQYVQLILEASLLDTISDLGLVKVPFLVGGVSRGIE